MTSDFSDHDAIDAPGLSEADAAALDALVEAGFDPERVAPDLRDRAYALSRAFGMLDTPPAVPSTRLTDRVISKITSTQSEPLPELSPKAEDAVDAFVMSDLGSRTVPSRYRSRAAALSSSVSAVTKLGPSGEAWVAEDRERRVDSTLASIAESQSHSPIEFGSTRRRLTLSDVVAAASVILVFSAVAAPLIGAARSAQRQAKCLAQVGQTSAAMSMPTTTSSPSPHSIASPPNQ